MIELESGASHPVKWLDEHGWVQNILVNRDDGGVCIIGAMRCAEFALDMNIPTENRSFIPEIEYDMVYLTLCETTGSVYDSEYNMLSEINDCKRTTQQNVRDALVKVYGDYV
jgi:hypothetical protein